MNNRWLQNTKIVKIKCYIYCSHSYDIVLSKRGASRKIIHRYKIGEHRQLLTDRNNEHKNKRRIDSDYKVGDKVLVIKDGILRKSMARSHGL
jgi:hypothetical protein